MSSAADVLNLLQIEWMEEEFLLKNIEQLVSLRKLLLSKRLRKRKHRYWVHDILKRRLEQGAYHNLTQELALDTEKFPVYLRMSPL